MELDYNLNLQQRIDHSHTLPLDTYSPIELELVANYILYADKPTPKPESKYTHAKCTPSGLLQEQEETPKTSTYTKPKPIIHEENIYIAQYKQSIEYLKQLEQQVPQTEKWKVRKWRIEHNLDMGTANAQLYPTLSLRGTPTPIQTVDLDLFVDLTNSFHLSKVLQFYSQLRQSEDSKMWIEYVDNIIEQTPLYDWQKHLLVRRIDGAKQITIGRELGEYFGKIVTPSTMSQALRTMYRQIAIAAEKELFAFYNRHNSTAWRTCKICGEKKLIQYDFYKSKPTICKVCNKGVGKNENK